MRLHSAGRIGRAALLLLLVTGTACGRLGGGSLREAQETLAQGDLNTALVQVQNVLDAHPDSVDAKLTLTRVLLLQGDLEGAGEVLEKARASGAPAEAAAQLEARLMLEQGRFKDLLARLDSRQLAVDVDQASLYRARALTGIGQVPEALQVLESLHQPATGDARVEIYISQAHAAFGRWALAAQHSDHARKAEPDLPQAWLQSGLLALRGGDEAGAIANFNRASELARDELTVGERTLALGSIADIALRRDDLDAARGAHERLVMLLPQEPVTEMLSARIALAAGDAPGAITRLEKLVQAHPEASSARVLLASALLTDGRRERAIQELGHLRSQKGVSPIVAQAQNAIDEASKSSGTGSASALARAHLLLDQSRSAQAVLERALKDSPDDLPLEVGLVQVLLRRGRVEEALRHARDLAARAPDDAAAHLVLAQALVAKDAWGEAVSSYEQAWRLAPTGPNAISLAMARQSAGQGDPLAPLVIHVGREPADVAARLVLASLQATRGLVSEAMASYRDSLALQPRNAFAANNLAGLYQSHGDPRALAAARLAFDVLPDRPEIADTYGWILAGSGHAAEAVPLLEKAVQAEPTRPVLRYHLAAALARRAQAGDEARARLWLADLLRDTSDFEGRAEAAKLLETMSQAGKVSSGV